MFAIPLAASPSALRLSEKANLGAYAHSVLPRAVAMQPLGLDWYGDFLHETTPIASGAPQPQALDMLVMQQSADAVLELLVGPKVRLQGLQGKRKAARGRLFHVRIERQLQTFQWSTPEGFSLALTVFEMVELGSIE